MFDEIENEHWDPTKWHIYFTQHKTEQNDYNGSQWQWLEKKNDKQNEKTKFNNNNKSEFKSK